jgi:hypothetical protein
MRSQVNMTRNNMPNHHIIIFLFYFYIMESQLHFCHGMSWQIYMMWKKIKVFILFLSDFFNKNVLTQLNMMYIFVYSPWCICF